MLPKFTFRLYFKDRHEDVEVTANNMQAAMRCMEYAVAERTTQADPVRDVSLIGVL